MDWRALPSLAALRAFEAAARLGSYSKAARELNVTHAAIAQHVRTVETHFGCVMMERDGQGMRVSACGAPLATTLSDAFFAILREGEALSAAQTARPLQVSTTPSIAESWLVRRLGDFWHTYPEIMVEISPSYTVVDLRRDGFDMAIRYGRGDWPGVDSEPLLPAAHVVVGKTGAPVETLAELRDQPWVIGKLRREAKHWALSEGLDLDQARTQTLSSDAMVREAVTAGLGLSIMPEIIVKEDIEKGRMTALHRECCSTWGYHLVTHPDRRHPALPIFKRWLKKQAAKA